MEVNLSIHNDNRVQRSQESSTKIINDNITAFEASSIFFNQIFEKITKSLVCQAEAECATSVSEITQNATQISKHAHCVLTNVIARTTNTLETEQEESVINLINENLPCVSATLTKSKITSSDIDAMFSLLMALFNANMNDEDSAVLKTFQNMIFCLRFFETNIA